MPSSAASGSQTAVIGTEHTLMSTTTAGTYVAVVDTTNMQAGDVLVLQVYSTIVGGSPRVAYAVTLQDVQGDPLKLSVPVPVIDYFSVTLRQSAGTGRAYPWHVAKL